MFAFSLNEKEAPVLMARKEIQKFCSNRSYSSFYNINLYINLFLRQSRTTFFVHLLGELSKQLFIKHLNSQRIFPT